MKLENLQFCLSEHGPLVQAPPSVLGHIGIHSIQSALPIQRSLDAGGIGTPWLPGTTRGRRGCVISISYLGGVSGPAKME